MNDCFNLKCLFLFFIFCVITLGELVGLRRTFRRPLQVHTYVQII